MTEPTAPAPAKPSFAARALAFAAWVRSPDGRRDIGAAVGLATAVYTGLHKAGVF